MKVTNKLAAAYLMWCVEFADTGKKVEQWLQAYYPEAHGGRGDVMFTKDKARAKRFESKEAAFEFWRQIPKNRQRRPDGKPNRPLTALSVELLPEQEEPI